MKTLIAILAVVVATTFAVPAHAEKITTKAACEAAGGTWDAETGKCSKRRGGYGY